MGGCESQMPGRGDAADGLVVIGSPRKRVLVRHSMEEFVAAALTPSLSAEITNAFLHYLGHYDILSTDTFLHESLHRTLALSKQMLAQINIAQHLSDALPGSTVGTSWHALALATWIHAPADEKAWQVNGEKMRERVEAEFTDARAESMARNLEEAEEAASAAASREEAAGTASAPAASNGDKDAQQGEGEGENESEGKGYVYVDEEDDEIVVADWENAVGPDERLTHSQGSPSVSSAPFSTDLSQLLRNSLNA